MSYDKKRGKKISYMWLERLICGRQIFYLALLEFFLIYFYHPLRIPPVLFAYQMEQAGLLYFHDEFCKCFTWNNSDNQIFSEITSHTVVLRSVAIAIRRETCLHCQFCWIRLRWSFSHLASLFWIFLALRTISTRRSKNPKPPSQIQKILRLGYSDFQQNVISGHLLPLYGFPSPATFAKIPTWDGYWRWVS